VIEAVTDDEIMAAYRDLARYEGIFCEPASAASVAGVRKLASEGRIDPGATIVCVLTGHGLKDPDTAARAVTPLIDAPATAAGLREALGW
jgi:threonine synthase